LSGLIKIGFDRFAGSNLKLIEFRVSIIPAKLLIFSYKALMFALAEHLHLFILAAFSQCVKPAS
jgi:hypothetical protein